MKFSDKLAKKPKIQKCLKKILPKLKQAEAERVKKMKAEILKKVWKMLQITMVNHTIWEWI